ncbi:multicopper oxidase domain-containing protein [Phthorimaea operculella]|nr:multicopper oxidase domain-containing protein [Phthorimaea operculella]
MAGHRNWTSVCSAVLALIILSMQGINSQIENDSIVHAQEYTTEKIAQETIQTDLTDAKSKNPKVDLESLDDVTFSDEATEVLPQVKVVAKKETKIPDSASRVVMPLTNFTINTLPRVVIKAIQEQASNSAPTKHVVELLEDKDLQDIKVVPKPVNQNKNEIKAHAQYDEVTGELKTEEHPCKRECKEGEEPMICFYHFNLEHYQTMSKACFNCPYNSTDCTRPDCIPADGMNRPITVVNRKMPGPSIEVCEGDRIIVDVENDLMTEATTVHWHGQHQKTTPYMDGTPYVTQCPILPETTFRYQFNAETPGTHFWHSHSGMQRADGAAGSLIIRKPKSQEPHARLYDYDRSDHVMIVTDWIHDLSLGMFTHHHHSWGDNKPPTLLINGVGRFAVFDNATHTNKPVYMKSAVFNVEQVRKVNVFLYFSTWIR